MPINRLSSGGIIANYRCPAACGHCLYGCSPSAEDGYIDEKAAVSLCKTLRRMGCKSLHIGGGEPFLHPAGLKKLIEVIINSGISLDYIETNAAWVSGDKERDCQLLSEIVRAGGDYLMVSADPFHVEFIPFWKPLKLIEYFNQLGIPHFVWQQRYIPLLMKLDPQKRYGADELEQEFGYDVVGECAREYGMGFNGRALNLIRRLGRKKHARELLEPCPELQNTSHFHVDFLGRYIAPRCTGMGILVEDLGSELDPSKYPVVSRIFSGGIAKLWEYALNSGYQPDPIGYVSKCELCFDIRKHLVNNDHQAYPDLTPTSFYNQDF